MKPKSSKILYQMKLNPKGYIPSKLLFRKKKIRIFYFISKFEILDMIKLYVREKKSPNIVLFLRVYLIKTS